VNIEEVLEALSDIETPPGSDDELDDTGEESSSTDEGSEGELESSEESESNHESHRASFFLGFCKGERKGLRMQNCLEG
jgi:hypothetical protein